MLIIVLILLYVAARVIWYLIPEIKRPPGIVTIPNEKAADHKTAEKTKRDAEKTKRDAEKAAITENKLQLLNMDIAHYSKQSAKIERIAAKTDKRIQTIKSTNTADFTVKQKAKIQKELENLEKAQIASDEKLYRIERKIARAALEIERLQTPE